MSTLKKKNSLRTIEAHTVQKLKKNESRTKCSGSYRKKVCIFYSFVKRGVKR